MLAHTCPRCKNADQDQIGLVTEGGPYDRAYHERIMRGREPSGARQTVVLKGCRCLKCGETWNL